MVEKIGKIPSKDQSRREEGADGDPFDAGVKAAIVDCIDSMVKELERRRETYLGYPNSSDFDFSALAPLLNFPINNIGDAFQGNNGMNTFAFEQEVIKFFAGLTQAPLDSSWGYVTSGGTEGNIWGLYLGREGFPRDKFAVPMLYASADAHYSVAKAARILQLPMTSVASQATGELDYAALRDTLERHRDRPAIMVANVGTTMKGATDKIETMIAITTSLGMQDVYIHCDCALMGAMLPLLDGSPRFDFSLPIGSMAISGHKFLGSPMPSGIFLTRKTHLNTAISAIEYISSSDMTLSGSRNGLSAMFMWYQITKYGLSGLKARAEESLRIAAYALDRLKQTGWPAWANEYSHTIVIDRPSDDMVRKWQLAAQGAIAHIITMPGVTEKRIDAFVADLALELPRQRSA